MENNKKPKTDRLMSREEYEQFDMMVQVQKLTDLLVEIARRVDKMEVLVYGKQRHNSSQD